MNLAELGNFAAAAGDLSGALCVAWDGEPEDDPTQETIKRLVRRFYENWARTLTDDHLRVLAHLDGCRLCQSTNLVHHVHGGLGTVDRTVQRMLRKEFESRIDLLSAHGLISPASSKKVRISHLGKGVVRVFREIGELLPEVESPLEKAFIGSSSEGLPIARTLQFLLKGEIRSIVWDQGTVFGLGDATIEALEEAVHRFDYGIFVFTPDDKLIKRRSRKPVARDNVLFELGLFVGKLSKRRAFIVNPGRGAIALPSDLLGMATATYNPAELEGPLDQATPESLAIALGPIAQEIRLAVRRVRSDKPGSDCG